MPDLDTGHIFLTTLAPIRGGAVPDGTGISYRQRLREALMELPTAHQSPATVDNGLQSPFARNRRTHLARMFVLDDVIYNGRSGLDAILASILKRNPQVPQPVDRLNAPYLVFCADIDAVETDGATLPDDLSPDRQKRIRRSYAEKLWETMGEELADIYRNCEGFDGVDSAAGFADYLERCHVETTMPFHDYYLDAPAFNHLNTKVIYGLVGLPALFTLMAALLTLIGCWTGWTVLLGLGLTGLAVWLAVIYAQRNGAKPLPPGPYDDLPSVLKALYVQQRFADFVAEHQGLPDDELHAAFGKWLQRHRPADKDAPTQPPGVIRSEAEALS